MMLAPQIWYIFGGLLASLSVILIWEQYKKPKLVIEIPLRVKEKEPTVQRPENGAFC